MPANSQTKSAGRVLVWVLLIVLALAGVWIPIYRATSQNALSVSSLPASSGVQLPTRLTYHTNGTASVWFQGQVGSVYRIDYADTKAAALTDMVWNAAVDGLAAVTNGWTEWVDEGDTNRPAPGEVNERYYRVVLSTNPTPMSDRLAQSVTTLSFTPPAGQSVETPASTGTEIVPPASVPADILRLLQKQAGLPPWNKDSSARTLKILQECAALQQLVTGGTATEDALTNALVATGLRISIFMTFGESLARSGDRHHAELFFQSVVRDHPTRATAKQIARCHLWLGKLHQDDALNWKYGQGQPDKAAAEFEIAASNYLLAKNASRDWVRASGWLGAATCYRELGDQTRRRECLTGVLNDQNGAIARQISANVSAVDQQLGPAERDVANYLLAASFYEQKRYIEAALAYRQMQDRLDSQRNYSSVEYPGQERYRDLARAGLDACAARQAERTAQAQAKGRRAP